MKRTLQVLLLILSMVLLTACHKQERQLSSPATRRISIITTLFPLYDFARTIAGDRAEVTLLLPPGVEPHSFEPRPEDLIRISKADIFIFTNALMEPWAERLLKGVASPGLLVIDASKGIQLFKAELDDDDDHDHGHAEHHHHEGGMDPHIWLDFANAQTMVDTIATSMAAKEPANRDYYLANANTLKTELQHLDTDYKNGLANCAKREFLHGGHYAFGYLARRYGLSYQSAQAVNPDAEPTPARIATLLKQLHSHGLGYVFSEELLAPRTAEMLSRETGAQILMLHAAHNISKDDLAAGATFPLLMRRNLANLRTGLGCR